MAAQQVTNPTSDSEFFSPYRPDGKLYGFICVVTGATLPIGRSIVFELAAHGAACVYACSPTLDPSNGQSASIKNFDSASAELAADVNKEYPNTKVIGYPLDIANEQETLGLIDDVLNACGRLDVWVCAAGWLGPAGIDKTGPRELQRGWEANGLAPFFALRYAPASMAKLCSKGSYPNAAPKDVAYGSIIVVSSVASTYGGSGVRINCISPGQIDIGVDLQGLDMKGMSLPPAASQSREIQKEHIGLERAGLPIEVARVVGFLASGFSSYITGANLVVDGGAS
ncbi:hypothetical protein MMC34_000019 [Xylographa carneopallida]|nr:hypothetical protein [Xylographa carneopallida]